MFVGKKYFSPTHAMMSVFLVLQESIIIVMVFLWASNALSWQWVAGANSSKKYFANQDNINKYCATNQRGTFLDTSYEALENMPVPDAMTETCIPEMKTIGFVQKLASAIAGIQIYTGEFRELIHEFGIKNIYYREHPLSRHYHGTEEPREWMFPVNGYYPSFFAYWKQCQKHLGRYQST